jgi:sensor domain CHASE-containing protein
VALVSRTNGRFAQVIAGQGETMILLVHQQRFNVQIFRAEGIRQVIAQRVWRTSRQVDAQLQPAVQLVHKLTAVAARRVVHGDGAQAFSPRNQAWLMALCSA